MARKISSLLSSLIIGALGAMPILAQTPAPEDDIRGPRGLIPIPQPPPAADHSRWWISAGIFFFALAALFLMRRWKKSHSPMAPDVIAKQSLQKLNHDDAHRTDESFANDVSAILRRYIQARFSIAATQRSTEEFLHEISSASTLGSHQLSLQSFLRSCDRAKFAKSSLDADARRQLIEQASTFVTETTAPTS